MYQRIDAGSLVGKALANHSVKKVFALQGGHIDPILYGMKHVGIEIIDTRHEQGAALMAEAWALKTGDTGVCAVTAGPGLTNAVTGLSNAFINGTPMVCLAGRRPMAHADAWTLQELDQLRLVEPITKWAKSVTSPERAAEYVRSAFTQARSPRLGPAYLDIPVDILSKPIDAHLLDSVAQPISETGPMPNGSDIDLLVDLLQKAERPMVVVGSGAHWSRAHDSLTSFANTYKVPIYSANAGRGIISDSDPWCFGAAAPAGSFIEASTNADLIICMGVRLGYLFMNGALFQGAKLVRIDINGGELATGFPGQVNIQADVKATCDALLDAYKSGSSHQEWADKLAKTASESRKAFASLELGPNGLIHPAAAVSAMVDVGGQDASYVTDGGDAMTYGMAGFPANHPGQLLGTSVYFGALGVGIPYAIASSLSAPDKPCLLWVGDGAFGFNAIEFETAIRHNIPFVAVVANNGVWGMSYHGQGLMFGYDELVSVEIGDVAYHELVRSLGGYGEKVTELKDLRPAIERAIESNLPACVNVTIDKDTVSFATQAMASVGFGG
ncbi:MAG: thiamine pyrophosphate-binding protein [Acidimicrobiales bacterium]|nr:thiamine pyrophosphate-binding protein [Acidimicrobiales bacterium]